MRDNGDKNVFNLKLLKNIINILKECDIFIFI